MKKSEIKEIIKVYNLTMISKSWFSDGNTALFNAYDEYGNCYQMWVDAERKYATQQSLSTIMIHEAHEISNWFFK